MRRGSKSGARRARAAVLVFAFALVAVGCETEHTTPDFGRNPPPPPQRMPRAIEHSTGVHLLSNELSDEEAEKLKQGASEAEAEAGADTESETDAQAEAPEEATAD